MFRLKSIRKIAFDWTNVNRAFLHTIIFTSFSFMFFLLFIFVDSIHDNSNEMKIVSLRDLYVTKSVKKMIIIHISFYINVHRRNGTFQSVVQFDFIWWNDIILNYNNETKLNDTVHRRSKLLIGKREFVISIYVNPDILISFLQSNRKNFTTF